MYISNVRGFNVKRFIQILSTALVGASLVVGVAAAAGTSDACDIFNTGPDSHNSCETNLTNKVYASCVNNIVVDNNNSQIGSTGQALVDGNTTGGNANSGSVNNSSVVVTNIGASCGTATTVAATTPAVGGKGAAASTPAAAAPASANVASLPHTGSNAVLDTTVAGVAIIGGTLAVSQLGVSAYRRFALK